MNSAPTPTRLLVIGGGPAGHEAASTAATLGASVTLVEESIVGGAAHLWDCIPSKTMVASARRLAAMRSGGELGVSDPGEVDVDMPKLSAHVDSITNRLAAGFAELLESQNVELISGRARLTGTHSAEVVTEEGTSTLSFDAALISTGSRPWVPQWAVPDGERILTTRDAYHWKQRPEHIAIVGSGVTGVEFVHIFASLGSKVTLLVSRHHVLPHRDTEVAMELEADFLGRGVVLMKGSRATSIDRTESGVVVRTEDGRSVEASHALLAVGSMPNSEDLGLDVAGVAHDRGFVTVDEYQRTSVPHIYAAGDVTGQLPLSSVATMQGRKLARHLMGHQVRPLDYPKVTQAIFTEPEIASVGLEEVDAAAVGRKVRITKVPFASNPRALIQASPRGFVKVISDPATREILGGTIVGKNASELIAVIALAVQSRLRVEALVETLMVHPSMTESLTEAAE